jgi:hypothetical protein
MDTEELSLEVTSLLRVAAQAHWTRVVLSQGAPFFMRLERRFPALSSFLGQSPAQAISWASVAKRLMSMPISRHDHLGQEAAEAGNGAQHFDGYTKRFDVAVDLLIDASHGCVQSIDLLQMQPQHEAVMGRHPAAQRRLQFRRGGVNRPSASFAKASGAVWPGIKASIMRRPERPRMSVMTDSSLMLASSSVFWIRCV